MALTTGVALLMMLGLPRAIPAENVSDTFSDVWKMCLTPFSAYPGETGLVACYPCDEGSGTVLHDTSGHGNEGTISGAQFVKYGQGFALRFDGVHDFVDCGKGASLSPASAVTVEAWVYPEAPPGAGEAGIVGKGYESFVLTYYTDGQCWWYISGGGNNCKVPLAAGAWHHVVGTFDGQVMKLYLDGALAQTHVSSAAKIGAGGSFFLGQSEGDRQFTKGARFKGMIDEVRVYDRALSAQEVGEHFRTTHLTGQPALNCSPRPFADDLVVRVATRDLGPVPPGAAVSLVLSRAGGGQLAAKTVSLASDATTAEIVLPVADPKPGDYVLSAAARTRDGGAIGAPSVTNVQWAGKPSWPGQTKQMRVLNNLVTELLHPQHFGAESTWDFTNPRDGWVYFRVTGGGNGKVLLERPAGRDALAGLEREVVDTYEAMRWLPAGRYTLRVASEDPRAPAALSQLAVRAIPELLYAKCGADPHVGEYGKYDWEFLKRYVLPNLNTMVGNGSDAQQTQVQEWTKQGKRWIVECSVPGLADGSKVSADEAEAFWAGNPGMKDPLMGGLIVDEFGGGDQPQYAAWTEAVRRIAANPALKGRTFDPYCGPLYGAPASRAFAQAVLDAGGRFALERYLPEQRTEAAASTYLDSVLRPPAAGWEQAMPGTVKQLIVCFGYFSAPPESLDVDPGVDHKVWLDMQFNLVANDPAFWRVSGLMTYLSSYADEETVRSAAKLFRHYAIEGRADRMTSDPYLLPHLKNPDFEDGLAGWTVTAAEPGSVSTGSMSGYSWLEGRYPMTSQGDTFLLLKRSAAKPNVVSQRIRGLQPGRFYSLRCFSAAIKDLATQQKLAPSLQVTGAESLPERRFQHVFPNCYSHLVPPFDDQHHAWMNYHWQVFRAKSPEAELVISDWASPGAAGGPPGQEIAVNFVEVQPYEAPE